MAQVSNLSSLLALVSFLKESRFRAGDLKTIQLTDTKPISMTFNDDFFAPLEFVHFADILKVNGDVDWNIITFCGEIIAS